MPRTEVAAAASPRLRSASSSGTTAGSDDPLSPRVQITTCTSHPAAAQRASVPPQLTSGSSEWAWIATADAGTASTSSAMSATGRRERLAGPLDPCVVDVVVGYQAHDTGRDRPGRDAFGG